MTHISVPAARVWLRSAAQHLTLASLLLACASDQSITSSGDAQGTAVRAHPLAFTVDVNARTRVVSITPPSPGNASQRPVDVRNGPSLSLLAGDVIRLQIANYQASSIGAFAPNKIRITFDVAIENKFAGIRLITPTWPAPPASGVILFPIAYTVVFAPGTVSGTTGNAIVVDQPASGAVAPSADFDGTGVPGSGAPYSFFSGLSCTTMSTAGCYRWKAFEAEIGSRAVSSRRTIGFDIDPSVAQFRALMIVAADLAPAAGTRSRSPSP